MKKLLFLVVLIGVGAFAFSKYGGGAKEEREFGA